MMKKYIDEKRCSEISGLAVQTFRNMRHQGKGPSYVKVGRSVRYLEDDVYNWLESHRVETEIS